MAKMGARRVAQVVQFAVRLGIQPDPGARPGADPGRAVRAGAERASLFA
jgi:hypothetical protein